jgi:hypothetical protein
MMKNLRVTLDRYIHGSRTTAAAGCRCPSVAGVRFCLLILAPLPKDGVILELKFDNQAPRWMFDLVKIFNLRQVPVCKYVACMYAQEIHCRRRVLPEQEHDLVL